MRTLMHEAIQPAPPAPAGLPEVAVVYTGVKRTLAALRKAAALADGLHTRIRLVVPQVVPYSLPLDRPSIPSSFSHRTLRTLLPEGSVETWIDLRLCRDRMEGLLSALASDSVVVMGTPDRWWPTEEERLARRLRKQGHEVLLVQC